MRGQGIERACIGGAASDGDADHSDAGGDAHQRGRDRGAGGAVCGVAGAALQCVSGGGVYAIAYGFHAIGGVGDDRWGQLYCSYRPSEHATLSEVERQVHELEHEVAETEEEEEKKKDVGASQGE